jgi:hypothetical protein
MYQRAWAVDGKVCVHCRGDEEHGGRLTTTKKAGTRDAPYRRTRPSGEEIDDVEASLAELENKAAGPLRDLNAGEPLTQERKHVLAQFFAMQSMRGPVFFEERTRLAEFFREVPDEALTERALALGEGDPGKAREAIVEAYLEPTEALMAMLTYGQKVGGVMALMRWQVIRFSKPRLVFSDHPVVLWPFRLDKTQPFSVQRLGPLETTEIRVPLGPSVGLLMNWIDRPDDDGMEANASVAAEFNAFTVSQADPEWMHRPGREPMIPWRKFSPLSRLIDESYDSGATLRTTRHARAEAFQRSVLYKKFVQVIPASN